MRENGIELYIASADNIKHKEDGPSSENDRPPFAVVSSNTLTTLSDGRVVRGREYPWGCVNIEDNDHCDFSSLQSWLWASNTQDLIDTTHLWHYEHFRQDRLLGHTAGLKVNIYTFIWRLNLNKNKFIRKSFLYPRGKKRDWSTAGNWRKMSKK